MGNPIVKATHILAAAVAAATTLFTATASTTMDDLPRLKEYRAARVSSHDTTGGNADALRGIGPGETVVLADLEGPGMITHVWCTIAAEPFHGRKILLRIRWDDEDEPSVLAPINDFFCAGHGINAEVRSIPITVTSKGRARNSFFKMPFNERAVVEIVNEGLEPIRAFYYYIDYRTYPDRFEPLATFHARYRQEYPAVAGSHYRICELEGRGHFVGCNLSIESNEASWWGEGDDRFFIDGEEYPSFHGTGSEDYLCDAWGTWPGHSPWYGSSIHEGAGYGKDKRYTSYRFHVEDPIPFTRSFVAEIEHYGARIADDGSLESGFVERADNWSSVAYWYQVEPHKPWPGIAPIDQRLPREAGTQIALLRFLRRSGEPDAGGHVAELRATHAELAADPEMEPWYDAIAIGLALAEQEAGNPAEARRLAQPYAAPFVDRDLADKIARIHGAARPAPGGGVRPWIVRSGDGSTHREETARGPVVVTDMESRRPFVYLALPPDSGLRDGDRPVRVEVRCRVEPGEDAAMMIEYDSAFGDETGDIYRDSEGWKAPAEGGWCTAVFRLPRARFAGRANSRADLRIAPTGDADLRIADVIVAADDAAP